MRLPFEILTLLTYVLSTTAAPLSRRSTPFRSLRGLTPLVNSFSNGHTYAHAPTKYFYESTFNSHYDGRFASAEVPFQERIWNLRLMLKAYTDTMESIGVQTWIMHGCLLGWWWGGGLMPWDKDLDFLMDEDGMRELGEWWNMTVHHFEAKDLGLEDQLSIESNHWASERSNNDEEEVEDEEARTKRQEWEQEVRNNGKKYLMEVNPNYTNKSTTDKYNLIDARWIDISNGLYIDITTLHVAPVAPEPYASPYASLHPSAHESDDEADEIQMYVKDTHAYLSTQIYPLRTSTFENVRVNLPFAYEELLLEEYGSDALTESWYNGYLFDPATRGWNKAPPNAAQRAYFKEKNGRDVGRTSGTGRVGHGWRGQGSIRNAGSSFVGEEAAPEKEDRWAD